MGATESKLAFRKNVFQLYEARHLPTDNEAYWANFYKLPETAEDVFNLFAPKDIRRVRDTAPENLETLVTKSKTYQHHRLEKVLDRILTITALTAKPSKDDTRDVLNCIRILTRILPYIFEVEGGELERRLFWSVQGTSGGASAEPWGKVLALAVVKLLFYRGFTLPESVDGSSTGVQYIIWHHGVGASTSPPATREHINNRTETLRLLLTLLSRSMYCTPNDVLKFENGWALALVTQLEKKAVLSLLCSLLNTAAHYDPVGWGLLPYNHLIFADAQEQLVTLCLQTLTALLDVTVTQSESDVKVSEGDGKESAAGSAEALAFSNDEKKDPTINNQFRLYVGKLHRAQDLVLLMDGFCRILKNPLDSANTYLPGSTKRVNIHSEVLMLFWKLLEHNEKFAHHAVETDKILTVLASLIYFTLEARNDPAQIGLGRMCCFILHILSQDRSFGVQLNAAFDHSTVGPVSKSIPLFAAGCWGDFLFLAIYALITSPGRNPITTLQENFLVVMANVSPYIKSLTVTTSNKLLSLFSSFSNPAFLVANENNHKLVFYLLEVFNNLIQYQITGNTQLVYSIIRHKEKFRDLQSLTYEHALEELQRVRALKAQKAAKLKQAGIRGESDASIDTGRPSVAVSEGGSVDTGSQESLKESPAAGEPMTPLSEKARGKLPAGEPQRRDSASSVATTATATDPKSKFQPNQEWFNYWHAHLPLSVILTLTDALGPTIEQLCIDKGLNDDRQIVEYLKSGTLVGLLPVPHPIFVRRFHGGEAVRVWFASYLWVR
ncbi:cell wall biogenesis protein [Borealophlyctis nickersoniae]|nr:cell wall biogenesis protein [Borealophlyctis nickersoniae]